LINERLILCYKIQSKVIKTSSGIHHTNFKENTRMNLFVLSPISEEVHASQPCFVIKFNPKTGEKKTHQLTGKLN